MKNISFQSSYVFVCHELLRIRIRTRIVIRTRTVISWICDGTYLLENGIKPIF